MKNSWQREPMRIAFAFLVIHGGALSSWELLAFQTKDSCRFFRRREFRMRVARKFERSSARRARLRAYLATGVGAIGLGTSSQAAVVSIDLTGYTGDNMGLPNGFQRNYYFIPNSTLTASNNYNGFFGLGITGITGAGVAVTSTGSGDAETPIKFGPGEWIDSSFDDFTPSYNKSVFKNPTRTVGDFGPNSFIGFKTDLVNGVNYYGYIEVLWTASTNTFKLISAAYEDTGAAIQTPANAPVPEPASGAVVALLMGGTALRQWRKKRRQESNEAVAS